MGFELWTGADLAWAAGTSEYRALGVAVIANTDLFRNADFRSGRRPPSAAEASFEGLFASLGQMNAYLREARAKRAARSRPSRGSMNREWKATRRLIAT